MEIADIGGGEAFAPFLFHSNTHTTPKTDSKGVNEKKKIKTNIGF
jgi:hypothetical protein